MSCHKSCLRQEIIFAREYNMITYFDFIQNSGANFTPATKIYEFAKVHHLGTSSRYGRTVLHYRSGPAVYHHYEIEQIDGGLEKVTIYLEDI